MTNNCDSQGQVKLAPYFTRSRAKGTMSSSKPNKAKTSVPSKGKVQGGKTQKHYCLSKEANPKGLMVLCSECNDWFHPQCVGISEDIAKRVHLFICLECKSD